MTTKKNRFVIVRAKSGIFAGYLQEQDNANQYVHLWDAIRIYRWAGACTLSQLAMEGTQSPDDCLFAMPVDSLQVFGVVEILSTTKESEANLNAVPTWKL
jgi:hypothetical protein